MASNIIFKVGEENWRRIPFLHKHLKYSFQCLDSCDLCYYDSGKHCSGCSWFILEIIEKEALPDLSHEMNNG